ncbi:hypothetical protein V491_07390 [Pseudogymnoascus sp. VKM F-3775]|nr:hypothetical protein V491_07390 [Pseudogymnoascus sp. VKM F-3775]
MQFTSILLLAIQVTGSLSASYASNKGEAPDLFNSSLPPPGTAWARSSDKFVCEIGFPYFASSIVTFYACALTHHAIPSLPGGVSLPLPLDVISAKVAAGKSVVMAESGAGLPAVTDLDPGTRVPIGDSAVSSSHVERIAIDLRSVGAAARVFKGRE